MKVRVDIQELRDWVWSLIQKQPPLYIRKALEDFSYEVESLPDDTKELPLSQLLGWFDRVIWSCGKSYYHGYVQREFMREVVEYRDKLLQRGLGNQPP